MGKASETSWGSIFPSVKFLMAEALGGKDTKKGGTCCTAAATYRSRTAKSAAQKGLSLSPEKVIPFGQKG
jgi:hypothetical protein